MSTKILLEPSVKICRKFNVAHRTIWVVSSFQRSVSQSEVQVLLGSKEHIENLNLYIHDLSDSIIFLSSLTTKPIRTRSDISTLETLKRNAQVELQYLVDNFGDYNNVKLDLIQKYVDNDLDDFISLKRNSQREKAFLFDPEAATQLRQYYIKDFLYFNPDRVSVGWIDLLLDIVYVGNLIVAGSYLTPLDLTSIVNYLLVAISISFQWKYMAIMQNTTLQAGMIKSLLMIVGFVLSVASLNCIVFAFKDSPSLNTGNMFIIIHVISMWIYEVFITVNFRLSVENIGITVYYNIGLMMVQSMIYLSILGFPVTSATENSRRNMLRALIWACALAYEYFTGIFFNIMKYKLFLPRLAFNVPHLQERSNFIIVCILGMALVKTLQSNYSLDIFFTYIGYSLLALGSYLSFYWLYFIQFHDEYTHPMNRNWWYKFANDFNLHLMICLLPCLAITIQTMLQNIQGLTAVSSAQLYCYCYSVLYLSLYVQRIIYKNGYKISERISQYQQILRLVFSVSSLVAAILYPVFDYCFFYKPEVLLSVGLSSLLVTIVFEFSFWILCK
ncbi:hypothetical protein HDV01_004728 [Terramyces sp. JEL0728]|nr:hypothetical protein HDV01_004728 [Terramyces sp. JEL0728]